MISVPNKLIYNLRISSTNFFTLLSLFFMFNIRYSANTSFGKDSFVVMPLLILLSKSDKIFLSIFNLGIIF